MSRGIAMMDWMKGALVRTPLEEPAKAVRRAVQFCSVIRHPGLYEIWIEEARIGRLIARVVHPSSNCVDVGCHLGSILSLFVRHAPQGRHLAFEPNPQQACWLARKFPEVEIQQLALSDASEDRTLYINEDRSGYTGLHQLGDPGERVRTITTKVARLDDAVGSDHRVDFLKLVVEGAELSVLRGGDAVLRRDRPFLLFECIPAAMARYGDSPAVLFEFLTVRHAYDLFLIKHVLAGGGPLDFPGFEDALRYPFKALKFAAAPRDREQRPGE